MSDLDRLMGLLTSGELLHPVSDAISLVDLANALHDILGVTCGSQSRSARQVKDLIGDPDHLVLVMADGFGMNFVETLGAESFMRTHLATEMRTVFPSTTPIALTSLATGKWPARHSVIGWFLKLREIDSVSTIISHVRTADRKALTELGVGLGIAYPEPSRIGSGTRQSINIVPQSLVDSVYSNYWTGGLTQVGYEANRPEQSIELATKYIRSANLPTCVYIYLPHVDSAAHVVGTAHEDTLKAADEVDRLLGTLADSLPSNARMVVTADHGHLDAPEDRRYSTDGTDEIARICGGGFMGDSRAVYADVPRDKIGAFREAATRKFGEDFIVLTAREVEEAGLLGADAISDETRYRMMSVLMLSAGDAVFDYREILGDQAHPMVSHHGGLTPAEMRIPLVLA